MNKTLLFAAASMVAAPAFAQGGDDCASATGLTAGIADAFDTTTATLTGGPFGCAAGGGPDLWYTYTASAAGNQITFETCGSGYDTALEVYTGDCNNLVLVQCNDDSCGFQSRVSATSPAANTTYYARVGGFSGATGTGTMLVTDTPSSGGNDDCTGAVVVSNGVAVPFDTTTATGGGGFPCAAGGGPDLWFSYTTQNSGQIVTAETCGSGYDTAIEIFDGSCAALNSLICNDDSCGLQSSASVPAGAAGTTYLIRVGGFNGATGSGTLLVTEAPDPCTNLTPDTFEDNDDCPGAAPISDGTYTGLNVAQTDGDFYTFVVADGATLDVSVDHVNADGDIDIYLWDPLVSCDSNIVGEGTAGGPLDLGYTFLDVETISYTNTTGAAQTLVLEIDIWDLTTGPLCNPDYTMTITGATPAGPGPIGTAFCPGNVNSTGLAGETTAFGELEVAANDVTLTAANVPAGQFGIFVVSQTEVPAVPVNEGLLCLGGALGRYNGPGQILQAGPSGEFSLSIDLGMIPEPMQFVAAQPGDTFLFQAWYRDFNMMGNTSNFTSGVELNFN